MEDNIRQKKRSKIGLVLLCSIVLCAVALAVFFLWGQNSEEKKQYEAELKQETQEFTEELVTELEQIDTSDEGIGKEIQSSEIIPTEPTDVPAGVITEGEKQVISQELEKLEDEKKQQVLQTLSVAYSKALDAQKQEAFRMADALIAQGKADWKALTEKGENTTVNKGKLATEYLAKSKVMEAQMDASFQALVQKMDEQLTAEGIDSSAIIAQYQAQYDSIKKANKDALMEKAMAAAKN